MRTRSPATQPLRRLHRAADAGRCAGRDHVADFERERRRQVLDLRPAVVDQVARVRVLAQLVVDPGADRERVRIADLVRRHQPRAERAVGVEGLAHRHGRRAALPVAHRDVVADREARDDLVRAIARHVAAAAADHEGELALVVEPVRDARQVDRLRRGPITQVDCLLKKIGASVGLVAGGSRLGDVVGVVEADRQELRRAQDRRFEPHRREREAARRRLLGAPRGGERVGARCEQRDHVARQRRRRGARGRRSSSPATQPTRVAPA